MRNATASRRAALVAAMITVLAQPAATLAFSGGIPSTAFPPASGCNACHGGGSVPTVTLSGPTIVGPGDTVEYTLEIFSTSAQDNGGLNVRASTGTLSTGGANAAQTDTISGLGGLTEITHSSPKPTVSDIATFSFEWTAPPDFTGSATLTGWGNAVNGNSSPSGDAASSDVLVVTSSTPDPCGDVSPLDPALVADPDAQGCQQAIAKAGGLYVKKGLKAAQTCLKTWQAGSAPDDPIALCAGSAMAAIPPTDAKAAAALAKAEDKLRALITAKCTDDELAALDTCAVTVAAVDDCLLATHRQAIADALDSQYGAPPQTADSGEQRCQATLAKEAGKFLTGYHKASKKCLDARNKAGLPGSGSALCIGEVSGGFVPPTDTKAAEAIAKRATKLSDKITAACSDTQAAALDACASTRAGLITCLQCRQRSLVYDLLGEQYGGS